MQYEKLVEISMIGTSIVSIATKNHLFSEISLGLLIPYSIYKLNKVALESYNIGIQMRDDMAKKKYKK